MKIITAVTNCDFTEEQERKLKAFGTYESKSVKKLKGDELIKHIGDADAAIIGGSGVEQVDEYVLAHCPNLKFISIFGSGTDFIDLNAASKLGIKVSNLKGANSQSVAEHAWGMILSLSKRITESHIGAMNGNFSFLDYLGIEMSGKTLGIIGYGEIGKRVAKIARGFDMDILTFTRSDVHDDLVNNVTLSELLTKSDVIAISVPFTDDTKGMIGENEFSQMKPTCIIVNTSREAVVNEKDLIQALESKKIFGYGMEIDIGTPANEELYKYKNVVITPHNGMFTKEAEDRCADMVIDNITKFLEGNPQNQVN